MTFITAHSNTVADRTVGAGVVLLPPKAPAHLSLEQARRIVRQPARTDTEIKAACFVLKTEGDWQDDWIVCQIEQALEPFELGVAE